MKKITEELFCDACHGKIMAAPIEVKTPDGEVQHFCSTYCLGVFAGKSFERKGDMNRRSADPPVPACLPPTERAPERKPDTMDSYEAASYLGITPKGVSTAVQRGLLVPLYRLKSNRGLGRHVFTRADLEAYKTRSRVAARMTSVSPAEAPKPPAPAPVVSAGVSFEYRLSSDGRPLFNEAQATKYLDYTCPYTVRNYVHKGELNADLSEAIQPGGKRKQYFFFASTLEAFKVNMKERLRQRGLKGYATAVKKGTARYMPPGSSVAGAVGFGTELPPSEQRENSETSH